MIAIKCKAGDSERGKLACGRCSIKTELIGSYYSGYSGVPRSGSVRIPCEVRKGCEYTLVGFRALGIRNPARPHHTMTKRNISSDRFSDAEVQKLLARAAELEVRSSHHWSTDELRKVAADALIDPAMLERAVAEMSSETAGQPIRLSSYSMGVAKALSFIGLGACWAPLLSGPSPWRSDLNPQPQYSAPRRCLRSGVVCVTGGGENPARSWLRPFWLWVHLRSRQRSWRVITIQGRL